MASNTTTPYGSSLSLKPSKSVDIDETLAQTPIVIKVSAPHHGLHKMLKCTLKDTVWQLKRQLIDKTMNEIPNGFNYGFYIPGASGKFGKYLDERKELSSSPKLPRGEQFRTGFVWRQEEAKKIR